MNIHTMACIGKSCMDNGPSVYYESTEEAKRARMRDKQLTKKLKDLHKQDLKRLKLLLLGTGESGKSTITKQMRIIHINGFEIKERLEKIADIRRNLKEAIVVLIAAMRQLKIGLENKQNQESADYILRGATDPDLHHSEEFIEHTERLWSDRGVVETYYRSHEFQLIDSAQYFLDRIGIIRKPDYIPTDQDILRCRVITTNIQNIEFDVMDSSQQVRFSVYDVGGQRGERKKWIQVFDSVVAILFLADCSSFDTCLREDPTKNRLLESMEIFEQVWKNRFLRYVSVLLFINKIDVLAEKLARGRSIQKLVEEYPSIFPDYNSFVPSSGERAEFVESFPGEQNGRKRSRSSSRTDISPDIIKTAVYIKCLFMKLVKGEISLKTFTIPSENKDWHQHHSCEYYYTCAVDTKNIERVLEGCRTLIIRKHLERFGII